MAVVSAERCKTACCVLHASQGTWDTISCLKMNNKYRKQLFYFSQVIMIIQLMRFTLTGDLETQRYKKLDVSIKTGLRKKNNYVFS